MASGDDLADIEKLFQPLFQAVEPASRRKLMDRLMRVVRRANAQRIAANVEPDGGAMTRRKPRKGKRGKMFRNIGKTKSLKVRATADEGEVTFANPLVEQTAATHHFGEVGFVGKTRRGKIVRTKYEARRLLGFGDEAGELLDEVMRHFE